MDPFYIAIPMCFPCVSSLLKLLSSQIALPQIAQDLQKTKSWGITALNLQIGGVCGDPLMGPPFQ